SARFDRTDERLDRMEKTQNEMAIRLISVEATVKEQTFLLSALGTRVNSLHGLVERLELRTACIEQEYVMITEALRRIENRFDRLEADKLSARISALEARVQALESTHA